jgi:anti-sigma factor ChrR (cupin superfamily)
MTLLLTCEEVTRLATEHLEGGLPAPLGLRVRAHLGLCKGCRAFLASLQALPALVGRLQEPEAPAPPLDHQALLGAVLARVAAPRPALRPGLAAPPEALAAVAAGGADLPLRLLVQTLRALEADGPVAAAPHLPAAVAAAMPAPESWRWHSLLLNGCRAAELIADPATGARLSIIVLPPGARFPDHRHLGQEDFLVLAGHAEDADHYLGPGDWLRNPPGSEHRRIEGRMEACWALARTEGGGAALHGWRGAVARSFGAGTH